MIEFFVPGKAAPGGSVNKFFNPKTEKMSAWDSAKGNKDWKAVVRTFGHAAYQGELLNGALEVHMLFFIERPKSHYRTGKNAHLLRDDAPKYPTSKPDTTKLVRAAEDALSGVIWTDDCRIVSQLNAKRYGKPGVKITIKPAV